MKREEAEKIMEMIDLLPEGENMSTAMYLSLKEIYQYCESVIDKE